MEESLNFIEQIIKSDLEAGKHDGRVHTRFPPEPNGYLHIGHAKAICVNFGLAERFGGKTNLRFDDTNPTTEDTEYVDAIKRDIQWLGFDWEDRLYFTSDYFGKLYEFAIKLIKDGKAYVDDSTPEEMARMRGVPTQPGIPSPYRERTVEENLDLFERMKNGEFDDGSRVLRAKIDMSSPNMHMRDPVMYRIKHESHHRTGDAWCIYPMYDFAHGQSDSIEEITHSCCSIEFENHRPLYDWFIENLEIFPSRQIEFARLAISYTVTSKRKLLQLIQDGYVDGWDDPRMPTLSGLRRRGFTPRAIRNFCDQAGVTKRNVVTDVGNLERAVREDLNKIADRAMVVLDPVKVVITNYPEGQFESLSTVNNPEQEDSDSHIVPFGREIWIEKEDFKEEPQNRKYFRLAPDKLVRLKSAYIIECVDFVKNAAGEIEEIHCNYFPDSKSGQDTSGLKAKGTLHWVSVAHAIDVEARLYDRLFTVENPTGDKERDFKEFVNPDALQVVEGAKAEPFLKEAKPGQHFQFMRKGYFILDSESDDGHLVFNRTVTLKDTWAKLSR